MKRRLRHLYWTGIVITMAMATVVMAMMVKLKIDDTRESLRSILHAASAWTMESTEDLQSMAESIASVSPPLRVTFLMEQGLVLADSEADALSMENHARISYSDRNNRFNLLPGDGRNIVYLNGEEVFSATPLQAYDLIDFGETKLLFVPLCGERFTWKQEAEQTEHERV